MVQSNTKYDKVTNIMPTGYNHGKFVKIPEPDDDSEMLLFWTTIIEDLIYLYEQKIIDYPMLTKILDFHGINYEEPEEKIYFTY